MSMEPKKTVLIVEDEKNIVDIVRFNLQREGYATLEAYDGEAGLALAREKKPDLILLDVMMPKMMGFDVCRALRGEGDNVPVIILTAREEEEDKILGLEIGADDYITKPFSMRELLARVKAKEDAANPALALENVMRGQETDVEVSAVDTGKADEFDASLDAAGEAPVIRMVNSMMIEALKTKASDIHFEAMEKTSRLRYRIDGALRKMDSPPKRLQGAIISRIKIMSKIKISEKRIPQDGRIQVNVGGRDLDLRVSTVPTNHGESIVMRILDKSNLSLGLPQLGKAAGQQLRRIGIAFR